MTDDAWAELRWASGTRRKISKKYLLFVKKNEAWAKYGLSVFKGVRECVCEHALFLSFFSKKMSVFTVCANMRACVRVPVYVRVCASVRVYVYVCA